MIIIFVSINTYSQQQHWTYLGSATPQNLWKCSFADTSNGWAVGDSGTIIHTSNGGINWVAQNSKLRNYMVWVNFINVRLGWALAWGLDTNFFGTYILKTTNGGITWDTSRYEIPDTWIRTIYFLDSLTGYMGGGPSILLKTTNAGVNWFSCQVDTSTIASNFPIWRFRFYSYDFGVACGGIQDIAGVFWKTTNAGLYWTATTLTPDPITDVKIFDTLNMIAMGGDYEFGASASKTSNGGLNWSYKNLEVIGIPYAVSFRTESEGWSPLGYRKLLLATYNAGDTWDILDTPDSTAIFDLEFKSNRVGIGVGLNGAIIKYDYSSVNIKNNTTEVKNFRLFQNYPNPFNPTTNIEYTVKDISEVELKIYNILGDEVLTLYKGYREKGKYTIKFTNENLPSGIYFYRLSVKNLKTGIKNFETKKMVLLK